MKDMHERLSWARAQAGFKTATDAARHYGWNENTYRSHEGGVRGFKRETAKVYADAYKISAHWLLYGNGPVEKTDDDFLETMRKINDPAIQAELTALALKRILQKQ